MELIEAIHNLRLACLAANMNPPALLVLKTCRDGARLTSALAGFTPHRDPTIINPQWKLVHREWGELYLHGIRVLFPITGAAEAEADRVSKGESHGG